MSPAPPHPNSINRIGVIASHLNSEYRGSLQHGCWIFNCCTCWCPNCPSLTCCQAGLRSATVSTGSSARYWRSKALGILLRQKGHALTNKEARKAGSALLGTI